MNGEMMIVAIVAIVCATGLIKMWINKNAGSSGNIEQNFDRLAKAFMQHKKEMQERIQNLEAIIANEDVKEDRQTYPEIDESREEEILTNNLRKKERSR